jgi:hypothetical protein
VCGPAAVEYFLCRGCNEVVVYRLLPWMRWFFNRGGVVGVPSCGGYMVDVTMCVASKVQSFMFWCRVPGDGSLFFCRLCAVSVN